MIDPSIPTLVCGDFNAVFDRALDRRGSNIFDASRESFRALMIAAWRMLGGPCIPLLWPFPG